MKASLDESPGSQRIAAATGLSLLTPVTPAHRATLPTGQSVLPVLESQPASASWPSRSEAGADAKTACDGLPQLVCMLDRRGKVLCADAALERWGLGRITEVRGRTLHAVLHPGCRERGCELALVCLRGWSQLQNGLSSTAEVRDRTLKRRLRLEMKPAAESSAASGDAGVGRALVSISDVTGTRSTLARTSVTSDALQRRLESPTVALAPSGHRPHREAMERARAERAQRVDQARYRVLAENISEGFAVQDEQGRLQEVNDALCRMLGYRREELLGQSMLELLSEPYRTELRSHLAQARGGRCQAEWLCRDGRRIHTDISLQPLPADGESSGGYCTIVTDVTERRQTERALRRSKCELRLLSAQLLAAQEMERKRIAYELHDRVGQSLSAVKFRVESAIAVLEGRLNATDLAVFQAVVERLQAVVEEVRRIAMDLRPSTLDDLGILPTIAWFCREFRDVYRHIELDVDITVAEQQVPVGLKTAIYRVLQEALNNVAKHAHASRVWVNLKKTDEHIEFTVRDDGRGLDAEGAACPAGPARGLGLTSMQERVESSGGTLSVTFNGTRGTLLTAAWPWVRSEA